MTSFLPKDVIPRFIYKGRKLGLFFAIKDSVNDMHKSGIVYGYQVPGMQTDTYHYIGETRVRFETRVYEHSNTDRNSSIYKHSRDQSYDITPTDFSILAKGYNNWLDRRLCEALFVRDYKPFLNAQKNSYKLELFT